MAGREITKVLITLPYQGRHWEKIAEALSPAQIVRCREEDVEAILAQIQDADVAILADDISEAVRDAGKKLRWVHCNHAGINNSARPEIFARNIILTSSSGRSAPVLAEHAFFLMLSLVYQARLREELQKKHQWLPIYQGTKGLYGKTLGIIGLGHTGKEVALRGKAFGMEVWAYERSFAEAPENVERYFQQEKGDDLHEFLGGCDVVVLSLRLSDESYHMIDRKAFAAMKDGALLINMARGAIVDEQALAEALSEGWIAGAGCDVFEVEPLPAESPLWDLPNMIITPHCTPAVPDIAANCVRIITENIRRYRAGEDLLNAVTRKDVYTK